MIKSNDGNVKLDGNGLDILGDFASIVAAIAKLMIEDFGISDEFVKRKLHGVIDFTFAYMNDNKVGEEMDDGNRS